MSSIPMQSPDDIRLKGFDIFYCAKALHTAMEVSSIRWHKYHSDSIQSFCHLFDVTDYSDTKAMRILNSELADTFGNLLSRACGKAINAQQIVPEIDRDELNDILKVDVSRRLIDLLNETPSQCEHHIDAFNFYLLVDDVIKVLHTANNFMETFKPWELAKDPSAQRRLNTILRIVFETLRITGIILQPIVPQMCARLLDKINVDQGHRTWNDLKLDLLLPIDASRVRTLSEDNVILFKRI